MTLGEHRVLANIAKKDRGAFQDRIWKRSSDPSSSSLAARFFLSRNR
jgi:hypothetical protein